MAQSTVQAKPGALVLLFLGAGVSLVALVVLASSGAEYYKVHRVQETWKPVEAQVLGRQVVSHSGRVGRTTSNRVYATTFQARYDVNGLTQISTVEVPYRTNNEAEMRAWADKYPAGAKLQLKYNPENPAQLVFAGDEADGGSRKMMMFGAIALAIGLGMLMWGKQLAK
jgi:hypothetical protein